MTSAEELKRVGDKPLNVYLFETSHGILEREDPHEPTLKGTSGQPFCLVQYRYLSLSYSISFFTSISLLTVFPRWHLLSKGVCRNLETLERIACGRVCAADASVQRCKEESVSKEV
jgi:hypothetical protein